MTVASNETGAARDGRVGVERTFLHPSALDKDGDPFDPSEPSLWYRAMLERWDPIVDILGGQQHMRTLALLRQKWAPKAEGESDQQYAQRVNQAHLVSYLKDAIEQVRDLLFSRPLEVMGGDLLREELQQIEANADRRGMALETLARKLVVDGTSFGFTHLLVDLPRQAATSLRDVRRFAMRPYFTHIGALSLFATRERTLRDGRTVLSQIRFRQDGTESDGFVERYRNRVMIWNFAYEEEAAMIARGVDRMEFRPSSDVLGIEVPGTWSLWQQDDENGQWRPIAQGTHDFIGQNLVTIPYAEMDGYMCDPPFSDLAWTNVRDWQTRMEQNNALTYGRFEMRVYKGLDEEEFTKARKVGANHGVRLGSLEQSIERIGAPDTALSDGWKDLEQLAELAEMQGSRPLMRRSGDLRATQVQANKSGSTCEAQSWARVTSAGIREAFRIGEAALAGRADVELPEDFMARVFDDFPAMEGVGDDPKYLYEGVREGVLSREEARFELRRRGKVAPELDPKEVPEAPARPALPRPGVPPDDGGGSGS